MSNSSEKEIIKVDSDTCETTEDLEKEVWGKKIEGFLSLLGYIVGLGNLWRFPYLCMKNGGGAFLIPFVVCIIFVAFPIFFLELSLGQFTGRSTIHCWEACPLFKGVGFGMVLVNGMCCVYYIMVVTWSIYFIGNSFLSPLPWSSCSNWWNTEKCLSDADSLRNNVTTLRSLSSYVLNGQTNVTQYLVNTSTELQTKDEVHQLLNLNTTMSSEEEFWQYNVLNISSGIEDIGSLNLKILFCLIGAWIIVYCCLMKGVKSVGKAVYVTATLPYILLLVLLIKGVTLPGATEGILYYITPNFSQVLNFQVWAEAAVQVFFSTCVSWGPLITMASYNNFKNNCLRDSILLVTLGEFTSVMVGFVVFSIIGYMAHTSGLPVDEVVKSGPGLVFIAYPEAVSTLPFPNLWAVLFFVMVLTLGLDTQFGTVEPVIAIFTGSYRKIRQNRMQFTALVVFAGFLLGLPLCFQGGIYFFQLFDWFAGAGVPLFGLIECIVFGWIYGADNFSRDIEQMIGRPVPVIIRILWCFVTPTVLFILLIIIVTTYTLPTYGNYSYPAAANIFGMITAIIPIIPIPIVAFLEIRKAEGCGFYEKMRNALKPTNKWMPIDKDLAKYYIDRRVITDKTVGGKIRRNILGR
ncbi:sodium- and chloride-dependent glycine transporter 1-like [Mytilus trossulus]|uniref:sodium- and chloride-dependent glycine transporter 1-like n=1 Tax=Mytilus trossulus TaxID=6551 RepID=UPI003007C6AF